MREFVFYLSWNLDYLIDDFFYWVNEKLILYCIKNVLSLSMGFGGMNIVVCIKNIEKCGGEL